MRRGFGVSVDSHPTDDAVVIRNTEEVQQVINLKDLSENVDVKELANVIISKITLLSDTNRTELEQVLFYLKKRKLHNERNGSASSSTTEPSFTANIDDVENYLELFYEGIEEKKKGALLFVDLAKSMGNLKILAENEAVLGALARVFREDWKKNFELATAIAHVFRALSIYRQFHAALTHHKTGALCLSTVDYELKRGESWLADSKSGDEKTARRCKTALRKQQQLLSVCIDILTNLATDLNVELKMARKDIVQLLVKCTEFALYDEMHMSTARFLLKLSMFKENISIMESSSVVDKIISWFPIDEVLTRKACLKLLFNLSFNDKTRTRMIADGLVTHVAPLIQVDNCALNLLYQLSINDQGKAMITFTDSIQLLMRDLLSGMGSDVTKAALLNVCIEKRNAQLVCGPEGRGLDLLMEMSLENRDLLVAKIIRTISSHEGPTQDMFLKWMPKLLLFGMNEAAECAQERAAIGFECFATAAVIKVADWTGLCESHDLVPWMVTQMNCLDKVKIPLQLQIVIMGGTIARTAEAAKHLVPLVEPLLNLLHSLQTDDEYVLQLLYMMLQMLRHKELAAELMKPESVVGNYFLDLMHDKNAAIREMCDNALIIIGEHSQEWARRIAGERFRWHNEQWLSMIEAGQEIDESAQLDDDFSNDVIFNYQFDNYSESTEPLSP